MSQEIRYLINSAKPHAITINHQRSTRFYSKADGGKFDTREIMVGMTREGSPDPEVAEFNLSPQQKVLIYYKIENGQKVITQSVTHPVNKTIVITHYPHLVNFKIGVNKYDERVYNCLVGQIMSVDNEDDFNEIWNNVGFMDEVNEKGKIIRENTHVVDLKEANRRKKRSVREMVDKLPKNYENLSSVEDHYMTTDKELSKGASLERTASMPEGESGEQEI